MSSKLRLETAIHLLFSFALLAIGIAITALANRGIHNMERYKFMTCASHTFHKHILEDKSWYLIAIYIPQNPRRPFDFRLQPQNLRRGSSNAILAAGIIGIVAGAAGLVSAIPFGELYHLSFCAITTLLSIGVLVASAVALGLAFDKNGSDKFRMGNQYTIQYSIGQRTHFTIEGWTCQVKDSFAPYQRRRIGFGPICHDMVCLL